MRRFVALVTLSFIIAACGPSKGAAKGSLQKDGYTNIVITSETKGTFAFTADDKDGKHCTGTIAIQSGMGTTNSQTQVSCE
jgi:hypothetical protein